MGLTEEDKEEFHKQLVERYGNINSWETNHWVHFSVLIDLMVKELPYEDDLGSDVLIKDNLDNAVAAAYEKETQGLILELEANKLLALAKKMEHVKGLEPDEKFLIAEKLRDDALNLL